ncbi:TetR/AcrR family transcriptional regulator [Myceligenerans salitolerans]|uniref:TetR/AcrR family transcriptional regulator n=1 Tax=Myceligenerans salitolerans TaxID=1230528 RepID=A0ABS3I4B1_9MICO|nr:TetR/AcrR family transcriptional regulator [Myceligenerans salitolerans]MBO0607823.1 TetR/AcrR family transcriptional regulator [Myceligenerans salitolerans]
MTDEHAAQPARPRRQARGRRRIEEILRAAAVVFADRGYDAATTNAIAAEAGISPGSLYQFFRNKDEVAKGLSEYYAERLDELSGTTFAVRVGADPDVGSLVGGLLEQIVAFNRAHPGFKALFSRTDMPAGLRAAVAPVQDALHARVHALISQLLPGVAPDESARVATVAIQLVRGMMPLITEADGDEAEALAAELHRALVGYLSTERGRPGAAP